MTKSLLLDLDHVQIADPKDCESAAREFFGRLLGLEEIEKPESLRLRGGRWFKLGSRQLHIGVEEDFRPARKAHPAPAFAVRQIDSMHRLKQSFKHNFSLNCSQKDLKTCCCRDTEGPSLSRCWSLLWNTAAADGKFRKSQGNVISRPN